ncbi:MAG: BlaI/MecI/CopY family transcriptional regulator [Angelakisella sp.]
MSVKIFDAEFPLMEYIWEHAPISANELANYALTAFGWKKNTTYTVVKRLGERGAIKRTDPGIIVEPLVTRSEIERAETDDLIEKVYKGSLKMFMVSFLNREDISNAELDELKKMIEERGR